MNHAFESLSPDAANTQAASIHRATNSAPRTPALHGRMEHRWGERIATRAAVRLHCAKWDAAGHLKDASLSGAFVHTRLQVPAWTQIEVELSEVRIAAYVVRVAADGLGIEWSEFAPPVIRELLSL
ncbi:MAG TPA: PilZ domain-containing protein [Steroidobacteraceae bacterium]|nr:PilZ domain-containing protein [Steroidobacteraceae bacterium]